MQPAACRVLSVVPSPLLLRCHVDRSGPRNICHFMHRLSAAKFRLQDCGRLLNIQEQHRARETAGLLCKCELSEDPVHDFLSFCEDLEPLFSPLLHQSLLRAAQPCGRTWRRGDALSLALQGSPCSSSSVCWGSGSAISLLLHKLSSFSCCCRRVHRSCG